MSTAEIRLNILDKIIHMTEEELLEIFRFFEDKPMLTKEQHQELLKRVKLHQKGEAAYKSWEEVKAELEKRFT